MEAYTKQELNEMWKRTPQKQIMVMQAKILEAINITNGKIAVCFSGGKDSAFLLFETAKIWKDIYHKTPLVVCFADTTNEHCLTKKYIKEFIPFVENKFGIKIDFRVTRPADKNKKPQTFATIILDKGLPLISKPVSKKIRILREDLKRLNIKFADIEKYSAPKMENVEALRKIGVSKTTLLTLTGYVSKDNKFGKAFKLAKRWYPLVDSDIEVTEICCNILKKLPMGTMLKKMGEYQPMIGEMAHDSQMRMSSYLKTGCNNFINGKGKSKPMGSMTEQGVLFGIGTNNIPISEYYGELECKDCKYKFSKEDRGGCALCGFGITFEPDRFVKLQKYEPAKVKWAFTAKEQGGAGYLEACEFLNKYCKCKIQIPKV